MESRFKYKNIRIHKGVNIGRPTQLRRDFQIHFLKLKGLQPNHHLLDVGCGALRGGIPLIDYLNSGQYTGIEKRKEVHSRAIQELKLYPTLKNKKPKIIFGDFLTLESPHKFDFIWAFAILYHIHDNVISKWFSQIEKYLADGGTFYGQIHQETHTGWGNDKIQGRGSYPILFRSLEHYQKAAEDNGLVVEDIGPCSDYGHVGHGPNDDEQRMLKIQRK